MSSLFSARGWWNINGTNQDAFDRGSMATLTPSGGSAADDSMIVMGGFGGKLRLYVKVLCLYRVPFGFARFRF